MISALTKARIRPITTRCRLATMAVSATKFAPTRRTPTRGSKNCACCLISAMNRWGGGKIIGSMSCNAATSSQRATTSPSDKTHHIAFAPKSRSRLGPAGGFRGSVCCCTWTESTCTPLGDSMGAAPPRWALGDGRVHSHPFPEFGALFDDSFQQRKVHDPFLRLLTDIVEFLHALSAAKHKVTLVTNIDARWLCFGGRQ